MPRSKPRYDLDNATIAGLASGFAKAGDVGLNPILHGEALWDVWEEQSKLPLGPLDEATRIRFQALVNTITERVTELNLIDPQG